MIPCTEWNLLTALRARWRGGDDTIQRLHYSGDNRRCILHGTNARGAP